MDGATCTSPVLIYSYIQVDYHLGCATIARLKYFPQSFGLISIEAPQKAKTACHIQAGQSDLVQVLIKATQLLGLFPPGAERNNFSLRYTPALSAAFNVKIPSSSAKTATSEKKKKKKSKREKCFLLQGMFRRESRLVTKTAIKNPAWGLARQWSEISELFISF